MSYVTGYHVRIQTRKSLQALPRDAFQRMDVHLDLTMSKAELLSSLQKSDYLEEYGDILKALGDGSYALVDKELWYPSSSGILRREAQTCITKKAWTQRCS